LSGDFNFRDPTPLSYNKVLAVKPGFTLDNPPDLHDVRTSTPAWSRNAQWGSAARLTVALSPSTTLTSLTAYRSLDYELFVDADISELALVTSHPHEQQYQFSEEATVSSRKKRLTWIGGVFLFDEHDQQPTVVGLVSRGLQNLLNPRVRAKSGALFGEAKIDVAPRASVTAGLRYSDERKAIDNSGKLSTTDVPITVQAGTAYAYSDSIENSAWTPKLGLDVRLRDDTLLYGSATRGFKSGGFNITSTQPGRGFAPEWAWSYEAGLKSALANGRATVNIAAFHTDYRDLQVQTAIIPGVIDISNAAAATIRGVEVENTTRLGYGFQVGGHLSWLDSRYDRYIAVGVGGMTGDVAGNRLSNAPVLSGRAWVAWEGPVRGRHVLSLRADTTSQSTVFYTPFNDTIQRQLPYGLLNVSGDVRPIHGHWSVGVFARNLTNQDYITGSFSSPPPAIGGRPGDPRQVGLQLRLRR
jgi:iron complex outermembrane receptor protein